MSSATTSLSGLQIFIMPHQLPGMHDILLSFNYILSVYRPEVPPNTHGGPSHLFPLSVTEGVLLGDLHGTRKQ